jgi:hypothetical protein
MRLVFMILAFQLAGCSLLCRLQEKEPTDSETEDSTGDTALDGIDVIDEDVVEDTPDEDAEPDPTPDSIPDVTDDDVADAADEDADLDAEADAEDATDAISEDVVAEELPPCTGPGLIGSDQQITSHGSTSYYASIAWAGSQFGISWDDPRDGDSEVWFARVSASGSKLGGDVRITTNTDDSEETSIAWSGSEFGLVWCDDRDGNLELFFTRVSSGGSELITDVQLTSTPSPGATYEPSIAWTGSQYGVSWSDRRDGNHEIYFVRVTPGGSKVGTELRVTNDTFNSLDPSLAWTGSGFGVVWNDRRDGNQEIYLALISAGGSKTSSDIRITNDGAMSFWPDAVWTGSEFGVAWMDTRDGDEEVFLALVEADGTKRSTDLQITNNSSSKNVPEMAWGGSEFGIAWQDTRGGNWEIYFALVSVAGVKIGSDFRVTNASGWSERPTIAWSGSGYGICWRDNRGGNHEQYFNFVERCH